jgi:hypothetical protein
MVNFWLSRRRKKELNNRIAVINHLNEVIRRIQISRGIKWRKSATKTP